MLAYSFPLLQLIQLKIYKTKNKLSHGRGSSNDSRDEKLDPLDSDRKGITKLADLLKGLDKQNKQY